MISAHKNSSDYNLVDAVEKNDIKKLNILLKQDVNLNAKNCKGYPILWIAIENNEFSLAKKFIKYGANVDVEMTCKYNKKYYKKATPLMIAVENNLLCFVKQLLKYGANPNVKNNLGYSPLMVILTENEMNEHSNEILKVLLLCKKTDINIQNSLCKTPLMIAIQEKKIFTAKILIKNGACLSTVDYAGNSPLMYAIWIENIDLACIFLKKNNVNNKNDLGSTALMFATYKQNYYLVHKLLKKGADVNIQNVLGCNALMIAIYMLNVDLVKYYLANNADIYQKNCLGENSLSIAKNFLTVVNCSYDSMLKQFSFFSSFPLNLTYEMVNNNDENNTPISDRVFTKVENLNISNITEIELILNEHNEKINKNNLCIQ